MNWTDEELMAHADGEGSATTRAALDAALRDDTTLRARRAALQAQRQRVAAAFASVLEEPVPDRLSALLAAPAAAPVSAPRAPVLDLAAARAQRDARPDAANDAPRHERRTLGWAQWGGLAASLVLGLVLGVQMAPRNEGLLADAGGQLVAGARLAQALDTQLASDGAAASGLQVQLSFVDRGGRYCRSFSADGLAGLACQDGARWAVQTTVGTAPAPAGTAMRQAASALPKALLDAVDASIAGDALTADQERAAKARGWKRP